jgi:two-component system phosphate regulon sensor histidine kinase PhoR
MSPRRSLGLPITLAIVMILLLMAMIVGWVLLAVFGALADVDSAPTYWTVLTLGTIFLALVLVGVVMYLVISIKMINLNRQQSNFIDSVTHELKSPIASLKLYLQTLNRHHPSEDEQQVFHRYMLEDVERLDALINHILDAALMEKSSMDEDMEDVDLGTLLRACADTICLRYHMEPGVIQSDLESTIVHGRPVELDIVFRNLIDNAVKYASSQPQVEITLRRNREGWAVIRISDNGRGIPPKLRRKIFGRFVRLGDELVREKPGTGLGLYIVRATVRRLGGRITLHGRDDGPGTVFEVLLPNASTGRANDGVDAHPHAVAEGSVA